MKFETFGPSAILKELNRTKLWSIVSRSRKVFLKSCSFYYTLIFHFLENKMTFLCCYFLCKHTTDFKSFSSYKLVTDSPHNNLTMEATAYTQTNPVIYQFLTNRATPPKRMKICVPHPRILRTDLSIIQTNTPVLVRVAYPPLAAVLRYRPPSLATPERGEGI